MASSRLIDLRKNIDLIDGLHDLQILPERAVQVHGARFNTYGSGPNSTVLFKETLEGGNTLHPSGFAAILGLITGLASMCA